MANNKVILNGETLIDLTEDTVTEDNLLEGETAHDASGTPIIGKAKSGASEAKEVSYDDTQSQLGADNVQEAIETLSTRGGGDGAILFTEAEWEALPDSEKEKYDGKKITITDDYESNICSSVQACVDSENVNDVAGASVIKELTSKVSEHYRTTTDLTFSNKGFMDITSIVNNVPSGATIHNIYVQVNQAGHFYVTSVGKNNSEWYLAYYDWYNTSSYSTIRSVTFDIEYTL